MIEAKESCIECSDRIVDEYGYYCDIACGKRTAWLHYTAGIKKVVEWAKSQWPHLFHAPYMSEEVWQAKLKEWGIES